MIRHIEYDEAYDNPAESAQYVGRVAKKIQVDAVEHIPDASPNQNKADDGRKVVSEISDQMPVRMMLHGMTEIFVHAGIISYAF